MAYLVFKTPLESGWKHLCVPCLLSDDLTNPNQAMKNEMPPQMMEPELRIPEKSLLKKEDAVDFRRVKINYLENGGEEEMAKDAWLNSRPFGKIEEGEETFTRKFKPLDD